LPDQENGTAEPGSRKNKERERKYFSEKTSFVKIFSFFGQKCKKVIDKFYSSRKFQIRDLKINLLTAIGSQLPEGGKDGKRDPV
jgi:hypothetical protein